MKKRFAAQSKSESTIKDKNLASGEKLKGVLLRLKADVRDTKSMNRSCAELSHLLRNDNARRLFTLKKTNGISIVLFVLKNCEDVDIMIKLCRMLLFVASDQGQYAKRVALRGGTKAMVSILRGKPVHEELLRVAFTIIAICAQYDKNIALTAQLNGILPFSVSVLNSYTNLDLLIAVFKCMRYFAKGDANITELGKSGALAQVVGAMLAHQHNTDLIKAALFVGGKLTSSSGPNCRRFVRADGIRVTLDAIRREMECNLRDDVLKSMLTILKHIVGTEKTRRSFIEEGGLLSLFPVVAMCTAEPSLEPVLGVTAAIVARAQEATPLPRSPLYFESLDVKECRAARIEERRKLLEKCAANSKDEDEFAVEDVSRFFLEWSDGRPSSVCPSPAEISSAAALPASVMTRAAREFSPCLLPHHNDMIPDQLESCHVAPRSLSGDILLRQLHRCAHPTEVLNEIMYDRTAGVGGIDKDTLFPGGFTEPSVLSSRAIGFEALLFESRFESGNLHRAIRVHPNTYDLLLEPDINCSGHVQWFYFALTNAKKDVTYTFNIINLEKVNSQFNFGMKPLMYSSRGALRNEGWKRCGRNIRYFRNHHKREGDPKDRSHYSLTFECELPEDDVVYLAYHFPYLYTTLRRELDMYASEKNSSHYLRRQTLCHTLGGNVCDLLTITDFTDRSPMPMGEREYVVLTARVHPGESNASWMMRGVLDFLLCDMNKAHDLRSRFIFKIIPMLNPDGVINGHHRTSLTGEDLNRVWSRPSKFLHPPIYYAKQLLRFITHTMNKQPVVFCDFHGHSRRKDIFLFGCHAKGRHDEKVLPQLLHHRVPYFNYDQCCFKMQKTKDSCARIVAHKELGIVRSYTMESSYCGPSVLDGSQSSGYHFNTHHLRAMGSEFCLGLLDLAEEQSVRMALSEVTAHMRDPACARAEASEDGFSESDFGEDDDDASTPFAALTISKERELDEGPDVEVDEEEVELRVGEMSAPG